jgi:hypothetical protein
VLLNGGQTQPATKAIKADGPDGWSSVSEVTQSRTPPRYAHIHREADGLTVEVVVHQQGATNKMVVLSSSHPALPADASVSSSTSTQSSLRPPTSAPQYV